MVIWESDPALGNLHDFRRHYISEMVKLFAKFYFLSTIFFVSLVKLMISEPIYLTCVFGPFWLP